uniref:Capsid protein n=2 Tax=Parvoviridae sp. TaxID=1940570 RepID=A0A7D3UK49_9VIRU|nr:MAG: capsid protein [Parvoviridae sp.]
MSKRAGWNWPGHRYLGPGNQLDAGEPVDRDDEIAREHDIAYERNPNEAAAADTQAIDKFAEDFQRNLNVHSLVGAVGLQAKKSWEGIFGQKYPARRMAPTRRGARGKVDKPKTHAGHDQYRKTLQSLSTQYKVDKLNTGGVLPWSQYLKSNWKTHWQLTNESGLRSTSAPQQVERPPPEKRGEAGPSGARDSGAQKRTADDAGLPDDPLASDLADDTFDPAMSAMDLDGVEEIANPSEGASAGGGLSGRSGAAAGGRSGKAVAQGGIIGIPRTPKTEYYTKSYRKSWVFFSYGYKHTILTANNNNYFCTPLCLVPVDCLAFYMDDAEFSLLHGRAVVVEVRATVVPLGCRMNFQVNATKAGWATSEFVAIGQSTVGLNLAMPLENRSYTPDSTKPMQPIASSEISTTTLDDKLYGGRNGTGMAQMIPRHLNIYATPIIASSDNSETGNLVNKRFNDIYGAPKFDQYVERWLVNSCVGNPVLEYSYKPKQGYITDTYNTLAPNVEPNTPNGTDWKWPAYITASEGSSSILSPQLNQESTAAVQGGASDKTDALSVKYQNNLKSIRYQTIETYEMYDWSSGTPHGNVQPQVHVGLTAVPAINPANDAVDFQNTSIYWSVQVEAVVHHYQNSCFHYGPIATYANKYYSNQIGSQGTKTYQTGLAINHHANVNSYLDLLQATEGDADPFIRPMSAPGSQYVPVSTRQRTATRFRE